MIKARAFRRIAILVAGSSLVLLLLGGSIPYVHASNDAYGDGAYGGCTYEQCPLTLTSSGTVSVNITPAASAKCTIQKDTVGVLTDSTTGYTLTFVDSNASNNFVGASSGTIISAVSGTRTSPVVLTANKWGYRIDDAGALGTGFGNSGTTASTNIAPPALLFAAVPTTGSHMLATSTGAANPTVNTSVWYGVCADASIPADTYSDAVTYTAVIN